MEAIAFIALVPVLAVLAFLGWLIWKVVRGVLWLLGQILRLAGRVLVHGLGFLRATLVQALHVAGALVTAGAVVPLTLVNLLIGRLAAARHYGRAIQDELGNALVGVYRLALGNPLRLVGLGGVVGSIERRLGDLVDHAPRPLGARGARASREAFPGYQVLGSLPSGGSGAKLFLARPLGPTVERLRAAGREIGERVVIKSFALSEGSTLPQIVRESRALEAASRLGLVHEHELRPDRFYYVTRYVPGDELSVVGHRLHARSGPEGLGRRELALVLGYAQDLLRTLHGFHAGGLWHKDVKPANVIVCADRAHLVDFGLVTPLSSALTLTTHGTEYYRDPEMVRLALQGVRVHEVDGVKFDLYSTGAVLYSLIEDSFPAQGSLSRITKRVPDALEWILRRAMADIQARYRSAAEMLADLRVLSEASDPFLVRPADLPSYRGEPVAEPLASSAPPVFAAREGQGLDAGWAPEGAGERAGRPLRRRRRGLAAVACVLLAIVLGRSLSEGRGARHWRSQDVALAALESPRLYADERASYAQGLDILGAVRAEAARAEHDQPAWRSLASTPARDGLLGSPFHAGPTRRAGESRARVLLLAEGEGDRELVQRLQSQLAGQGLEILALGHGSAAEEDEILRLTAGARHAMGLSGADDPETSARLRRYLLEEPELGGIVWLAGPGEDGARMVLVVEAEPSAVDGLYRLDAEPAVASH